MLAPFRPRARGEKRSNVTCPLSASLADAPRRITKLLFPLWHRQYSRFGTVVNRSARWTAAMSNWLHTIHPIIIASFRSGCAIIQLERVPAARIGHPAPSYARSRPKCALLRSNGSRKQGQWIQELIYSSISHSASPTFVSFSLF